MARVKVHVTVDGVNYVDEVEPRTLLVQYLREQVGKVGTVIGCDTSNCGACTVHLAGPDGASRAVKSCSMLAAQADGCEVTTIEGLASADGTLHPVQQAFQDEHALQCGYCTPGMVMAVRQLIEDHPGPTEDQVRHALDGNICRCTGYQNIVAAALRAARAVSPERSDQAAEPPITEPPATERTPTEPEG